MIEYWTSSNYIFSQVEIMIRKNASSQAPPAGAHGGKQQQQLSQGKARRGTPAHLYNWPAEKNGGKQCGDNLNVRAVARQHDPGESKQS